MADKMRIRGGLDVGNGYVKGKLEANGRVRLVDMPSQVSYISGAVQLPVTPDDEYMADVVNELDCTVTSPAINPTDIGRTIVGHRAVVSGETAVIFNLDDARPKCDDALSVQLTLAAVAGTALTQYWDENHEIPAGHLEVEAALGVALPIGDYTAHRESYRRALVGPVHTVAVHNFEREISVDVVFTDVVVLPEGVAAQYAIVDKGPEFLDAALALCREDGMPLDGIDGAELYGYENIIGIDIGEGTVNFPVFRDGKVSVEVSSSINKGYGTVLSKVVAQVRSMPFAPESRKELAEFMKEPAKTAAKRQIQAKLQRYIDEEVKVFARDVINEYKSVLAKSKLSADAVYVYGGGADPVRSILYPALMEASKLDEGIWTPVVYLDSSYSRDLNRTGLFMVAPTFEVESHG